MNYNPKNYLYPPRTTLCIPKEELPGIVDDNWTLQLKFNDSRCLIKYQPGQEVELWNRHASKFKTYTPSPELSHQLEQLPELLKLDRSKCQLLDGGLLHQKHQAIKHTIVIWDVLVKDGDYLVGSQYRERYDFLPGNVGYGEPEPYTFKSYILGRKMSESILIPDCHQVGKLTELWEMVEEINRPYYDKRKGELHPVIEGVVAKNLLGKLEFASREANNSSWMLKSRVHTGRHNF